MASRDCDTCGRTYQRRRPSEIGKYCSRACSGPGRTKADPGTRRNIVDPTHPLSPETGRVGEHRRVLYAAIGAGAHPCHWCGNEVRWIVGEGPVRGALVVDHLDSDWRNNELSNLVPACQGCNATRSRRVLGNETFVVGSGGKKLRGVMRVCPTCSQDFVAIPSRGRQTFCSRRCANGRSR